MSLNLPSGWQCQSQDQNFICLDESASSQKNTAIVVTYKNRSPEDALVVYRDQLSRPRTLYQGDVAVPSEPKGAKEININNAVWVEGIHFGSEVPEYFTHYYATVAGQHAILISMSVEKNAYQNLRASLLNPIINSIQLSSAQSKNDLAAPAQGQPMQGAQTARASNLSNKNKMTILGQQIPRKYVYLGGAFILVLVFMGYALLSD